MVAPLRTWEPVGRWPDAGDAMACLRHVQRVIEYQRLPPGTPGLDDHAAAVVRSLQDRDLERLRSACWAMVQVAERMPRGRYDWTRRATPAPTTEGQHHAD